MKNGIEAAGHMGNKEIASFLLSKGARLNFFTLCMLGDISSVKKVLQDHPFMLNAKGPHGFTPLHHANQGGEQSLELKKYLISLGATETQIKL
ncbi:MAG: ankyrin repeat domain-containing protein [Chitinophagaceae bacterium]|nr:ankyrin repeat domain-containing protein [Chitinophagaceae bacterium]